MKAQIDTSLVLLFPRSYQMLLPVLSIAFFFQVWSAFQKQKADRKLNWVRNKFNIETPVLVSFFVGENLNEFCWYY